MADTKHEFTQEDREAIAQRIYRVARILNAALQDVHKAGLECQILPVRDFATGKTVVQCHVFQHVCFNEEPQERPSHE